MASRLRTPGGRVAGRGSAALIGRIMRDDAPSDISNGRGRAVRATLVGLGIPTVFYFLHLARFHRDGLARLEQSHFAALALALLIGLTWSRIYLYRNRWMDRPGTVAFLCAFLLPLSVKLSADFLIVNSLFDEAFWVCLALCPVAGAVAADNAIKVANRIRTAESRLRRLAGAASDGLWEADLAKDSVYWSESFRRNFGYESPPPGTTMAWFRERIHPDDRAKALSSFESALHSPKTAAWTATFRFLKGEGFYVWVNSKGRIDRSPDGNPLFAYGGVSDISDRIAKERLLESLTHELEDRVRELSAAELRTMRLARAGADGLWTLDYLSGERTWDSAFITSFRFPPATVPPTTTWWVNRIHPDDRTEIQKSFAEAERDPTADAWQKVYRLRRGDDTYAWVMDTGVFERDATGKVLKALGGIVDISDRIKLEDELRAGVERRTRDLAALTRSVTHDLKSPLTSILGYGDLIEASGSITDEKSRERLRHMMRAGERMLFMINDILEQSKGGEASVQLEPVALYRLVEDLRDEFAARFERLGGSLFLPAEPLPEVLSAYAPLYRMLQNLVGNAIKYRRVDVAPEVRVQLQLEGNWLIMSVSDNGVGIKKDNLASLFDFGTRFDESKAEGHGIGLYNVQSIARRLGGDVCVTSTLGQGSTFTVKVPGRLAAPPSTN